MKTRAQIKLLLLCRTLKRESEGQRQSNKEVDGGKGKRKRKIREGGDDEDGTQSGASPDALTTLLFTKPSSASTAVGNAHNFYCIKK